MVQRVEVRPPSLNRRDRRQQERMAAQPPLNPLKAAINDCLESGNGWNKVISENSNLPIVLALYQPAMISVLLHHIEKVRALSMVNQRLCKQFGSRQIIPGLGRCDVYTYQINGTSLMAIEQMPVPLNLDNIAKISRFFYSHPLIKWALPPEARLAQDIAVNLSGARLANPDVALPTTLRPLTDRLEDCFDYWSSFLTRSGVDPDEEEQFFRALLPSGPRMFQGLAGFIPARLGITPASATRLIHEKESSFIKTLGYAPIRRYIVKDMQYAYRQNNLPPELEQFQHYDPKADKEIVRLLHGYSQQHIDQQVDYLERVHEYRRPLRAAILGSKEHFLTLPLDHPLMDVVTVAVQPQYKNSLMFAAHLRGTMLNLVLETNGGNRIYGIPPALLRENPHIGDNFGHNILEPIVAYAEARFPGLKPRPASKLSLATLVGSSRAKGVTVPQQPEEIVIDDKPIKRKRLSRSNIIEPNLPARLEPEEMKPIFRVEHTRSEVEKLMGRNKRSEDIERIMEVIRRFEMGSIVDKKKLTDIEDFVRLRVGHWRLVLHDLGQAYELVEICRRDDATSRQLMRQFH